MKIPDPEQLYREFHLHLATCAQCRGEPVEQTMCADGLELLKAWGQAEKAYAEMEHGIEEVSAVEEAIREAEEARIADEFEPEVRDDVYDTPPPAWDDPGQPISENGDPDEA